MPEIIQNVLIIMLPMFALFDNRGATIISRWPITIGLIAGLIMGNLTEAMKIAGTFQLMSLGVAAFGGTSIPDYGLATTVAVFLSARSGVNVGTAVTVGLPVGMLALNLEVFGRTLNSFVSRKSLEYLDLRQFKKMEAINWLSILFVLLQSFIPMIILVLLGPAAMTAIISYIPEWFTRGLNIAGGMIPVIGIVMLMSYMPTKKYFWAVLIGFVFTGYLQLPVLAISIIGFALAMYVYSNINQQNLVMNDVSASGEIMSERMDFDE